MRAVAANRGRWPTASSRYFGSNTLVQLVRGDVFKTAATARRAQRAREVPCRGKTGVPLEPFASTMKESMTLVFRLRPAGYGETSRRSAPEFTAREGGCSPRRVGSAGDLVEELVQ